MAVDVCMDHSVQLVFDTNILVDAMTARGHYASYGVELLEMVRNGEVEGWYAPHSVTTVYYLLERTLRKDAESRQQATQAAQMLLKETLTFLTPLPQTGDELLSLSAEPGDDLEDLLIIQLANDYLPNPLFVTRDKWFLTMGASNAAHPKEIIETGLSSWGKKDTGLPFIDLTIQQRIIRPQLEKNIHKVLNHGRYILGPEVKELETQLADYAGTKHCIGVSNGTDALLMSLMAQNIGPGDAVFTTPFTFIATAEVIQLLGATPVFVDIDPESFNMDPRKLALAIQAVQANAPSIHPLPQSTDHNPLIPKAIIPVDLFGLPADYDSIMEVANEHKLFVLGDSAQGFGGEYKGRKSVSLGHAATTSFFPAKPLGCYGDGGAILTNSDDLADKLESIRVHGKGKDKYDNIRIGLNARLHTMQAAVLLPKLEIFPGELQAKQKIAEQYTAALNQIANGGHLLPPHVPIGYQSAWAQYSILARSTELREKIQLTLKNKDIPSMVYYATPLHVQTAFANLRYQATDFPISMDTAKRIFSIPMHAYLTAEDINKIITTIDSATK